MGCSSLAAVGENSGDCNSMELAIGIVGLVLAVVAILATIFAEEIRDWIVFYVTAIAKGGWVSGEWIGSYHIVSGPNKGEFSENLLVRQLGKNVIVRIESKQGRLRARGKLRDQKYLTGTWIHNKDGSRYHGAFQLIFSPEGDNAEGRWVGYSGRKSEVRAGKWRWQRVGGAEPEKVAGAVL